MIIETKEYREMIQAELDIFDMTLELAAHNKRYNTKCAALVVQGLQKSMRIICGNFASFRSSRYQEEPGYHSEMIALDAIPFDVDNLTIYVARLNIKNEALPSRPCKHCMKELSQVEEITSIIYMSDGMKIVKELLK